jgi:hypothetical protein
MEIEKIEELPVNLRGRPASYPFEKLNPGEKLLIPIDGDKQDHRKKVTYALYYHKKSNNCLWQSAVRVEGINIVVYRIN